MNQTLTHVFADRLRNEPDAVVSHVIHHDGTAERVTVKILFEKAMAYARLFRPSAPAGGEERKIIGVCLPTSLDLHAAFLGAIWSGNIPTMLAPPSPRMEPAKYRASFLRMLEHIKPASVVVSSEGYAKADEEVLAALAKCNIIDPSTVPAADHVDPTFRDVDEVVLLQHSSGTTGAQKGVALSHRAILAHNEAYRERLQFTSNDVIVSWMPLYHDMGLIACFILPILERFTFVELSPFHWLEDPVLLFELIERFKGTICSLPNFAYAHLAKTIDPKARPERIDLSSIRAWINASEPTYHSTHDVFVERFREWGVREDQLTCLYGMAENVLCATQVVPGELKTLTIKRQTFLEKQRAENATGTTEPTMTLISNGKALPSTELIVMGPNGERLADDVVGEIAVRGKHLFAGYFRRPDLTEKAMTPDGFYRSGDLGFIRDGHVYVTGRKNDLLILQGSNFYPTDIEQVVSNVEGVVPGRAVAFGVPDEALGTDRLVVLLEAQANVVDVGALATEVEKRVIDECGCRPGHVAIVPPRWLVKSTSGKMARNDNRNKYLASKEVWTAGHHRKEQSARVVDPPKTDRERTIARLLAAALGVSEIGATSHLGDLGLDSLRASVLLGSLRSELGLSVPFNDLFASTVRELAARTTSPNVKQLELVANRDSAPLSSTQLPIWVLAQLGRATPETHASFAMKLEGGGGALARLETALVSIIERQKSLRTVVDTKQVQHVKNALPKELWFSHRPSEDFRVVITEEAKRPFDLTKGPLFRFVLCSDNVLVLVASHLVMDGFSYRVLLHELAALYRGEALSPLSFHYVDYAASERRADDGLEYWKRELANGFPKIEIGGERKFVGSAHVTLSAKLTSAIQASAKRARATFFVILLTAYRKLIARQTGLAEIWVGMSTANRDMKETLPLIGQFSNMVIVKTTSDAIENVRMAAFAALDHKDVRFHEVLRLPHLRQAQAKGYFLPVINFDDAWSAPIETNGLRITPIEVDGLLHDEEAKAQDYVSVRKNTEGVCTIRFWPGAFLRARFESANAVLRAFVETIEELGT